MNLDAVVTHAVASRLPVGRRFGRQRQASVREGEVAIGCQLAFKDIVAIEKARHRRRCGAIVDPVRIINLQRAALVQDDNAVTHRHGLQLVARHMHEAQTEQLADTTQFHGHTLAQVGIKRAEWLVQQADSRIDDQGARQGHALLLATGDLPGHAVAEVCQAD